MAAIGHPLVGDPLYGPGGTPKQAQAAQGDKDGLPVRDCADAAAVAVAAGQVGDAGQLRQQEFGGAAGITATGAAGAGNDCMVRHACGARTDGPVSAVPGDCGYHLHSHQLWVAHPGDPSHILHLVAPPPPELLAPWELTQ